MDVEKAQEICKEFGCHAYINITIDKQGNVNVTRINFWELKREDVMKIKRRYGWTTLKKRFVMGDVDYKVGNVIFNQIRVCKITGYREKVVPEHTEKIPVYDCR